MIQIYDSIVLKRPKTVLLVLLAIFAFFAHWSLSFRLDASGESIVLEHDEDVRYARTISDRYDSADFVFITYTPAEDLFSKASLDRLKRLRGDLQKLERVDSVVTLLDVPLIKNPPGTLKELKDNMKTLESPEASMPLAIAEFRDSPIYQNLIVSSDLKSTGIQVSFRIDKSRAGLINRRSELLQKEFGGELTPAEEEEFEGIKAEYRIYKDERRDHRHEDIQRIRKIIEGYRGEADLFLGGVPMIVDDIIEFIKNDLKLFGLGMFVFLIVALGVIFRRKRWILLPMLCCAYSVITMMGLLGIFGWEVTVVSSNFISLQLIFTMSLAIHIIVRYRELLT
ncbi:MAG: MMPL family transporter, partial [Elusimicrobiota bacterium]